MKYLGWLISFPLTVFAILFIFANQTDVAFRFTPFDAEKEISLYMIGIGMLFGGFLLGGLFVWIQASKTRLDLWKTRRRANQLEKELDHHKKLLADAQEKPALQPVEDYSNADILKIGSGN